MCATRDPIAQARMFGGINFGNLVKNSPIRQIKITEKVSGYTVLIFRIHTQRKPHTKAEHLFCCDTNQTIMPVLSIESLGVHA